MPAALAACRACPRLAGFLDERRLRAPADWNGPVPGDGPPDAPVLIVGLAPGLGGANRTGRPFRGDASGRWLYAGLRARGWLDARGEPVGVRITNAVKCVPPANRPTPAERATCRSRWLSDELAASPARVIVALGAIAHAEVAALAGARLAFRHGAEDVVAIGGRPRLLLASYHPSPQNTNTRRLTTEMFEGVLVRAAESIGG